MISLATSLKAVGGAHTGIAPVNLLDVLDVNGNLYYWADRAILVNNAITSVPPSTGSGAGARIYVPTGAATVTVDWEDQWGGGDQSFGNGSIKIIFDGEGGATITFTGESSENKSINDFGVGDIRLVGAALGVTGPIDIPDLPDAGEELVVQIFTSAWGSYDAYVFVTGPASSNPDNYQHAKLTWTSGQSGVSEWIQPDATLTAYKPWLLSVPQFSFHRSLQTDVGAFVLQNLSGDTLSRDFEKIARSSALEGAFFVYRCWQPDAEAAWLEVHGTLTLGGAGDDTAQLKGTQLLNPSQDDTPLEDYSETCQLQWGGVRCGATGTTECTYSYQSCQVVERIMVVMNNYEKNFGETAANTAQSVINRRRKI